MQSRSGIAVYCSFLVHQGTCIYIGRSVGLSVGHAAQAFDNPLGATFLKNRVYNNIMALNGFKIKDI